MATPGRTAACRRPSTLPKMLAELRVLASSRASPNLDPRRGRRWLPRADTLRCCSCWSRCCSCCCYCSCCCWCGSAVLLLRLFLRLISQYGWRIPSVSSMSISGLQTRGLLTLAKSKRPPIGGLSQISLQQSVTNGIPHRFPRVGRVVVYAFLARGGHIAGPTRC